MEDGSGSHETDKGLFSLIDGIFLGEPLALAPRKESSDGGPCVFVAGLAGVIFGPDGVSEADEGIEKLDSGDEATVLMVEGVGGRGIRKGTVFFVGGRVGGPEAGVSRVLEGAASIVILVIKLVKMGWGKMAAFGTADGDGMDRGNVVSELAILMSVCARTLWRTWRLESVERLAFEG